MRRILATIVIAALGTLVVGVGIALAAEIEVTPDQPAEGPAELTIEVTRFAPDTPIFAVPCEIPATGVEIDLSSDTCDVSLVETATTDNGGNATLVVEWSVPAEGMAVYVGDETRTYEATQIISPEAAAEAQADDEAPEVAVLGTTVVQEDDAEDLADTGPREIVILSMFGTALIGLGMTLRSAERLRTVS